MKAINELQSILYFSRRESLSYFPLTENILAFIQFEFQTLKKQFYVSRHKLPYVQVLSEGDLQLQSPGMFLRNNSYAIPFVALEKSLY